MSQLHFLCALLLSVLSTQAATFYVTPTGSGNNSGTDWSNASPGSQLRTKLAAGTSGDIFKIAQGTYKPTTYADGTSLSISFSIPSGVQVYGGYTTGTENRNFGTTVFSGDIDNDNLLDEQNSTHVVYFDGVSSDTRLDGVVIEGGYANGLLFLGWGGGVFNNGRAKVSKPLLINCYMRNNYAERGSGMFNDGDRRGNAGCQLINCVFSHNYARSEGGGLTHYGDSDASTNPALINCVFYGNSTDFTGGGISIIGLKTGINLFNCIIWANTAGASDPGIVIMDGVEIQYSNVQDVPASATNINVNPLFVDAPGGDFRLQTCSPLIDAGDPASTTATSSSVDLAGNPRFYNNGRIDMGAYEYQGNLTNPVAITTGPASASAVCVGSTVSVPVSATGTALSYQWYKEGTLLEAQTSAMLSLTQVQASQAGSYSVVVSNACSSTTSLAFVLTVYDLPAVAITPTSPTVCAGSSVTLTASGEGTYLWDTGKTTSSISVTPVATMYYSVTVTTANQCSSTASTQVTVRDQFPVPTLASNPSAGSPGSLTVIQNTPYVTLTASGCSGLLNWSGSYDGSDPSITVSTLATGTFSYSVNCQLEGCTSPTATFTVLVTPSLVSGSFDGFVNGADCSTFRGWAWDRNKPNTAVTVDILDGPRWSQPYWLMCSDRICKPLVRAMESMPSLGVSPKA
ncbi:hypothetical protein GCM10028804_55180 [Larkinella terrae]